MEWWSIVVVALMSDHCAKDWFFTVNWDINSVVIDDCFFFSRFPIGPMEPDGEIISFDEGSKEMQVISFGVYMDKSNSMFCSKGEDGRCGES